MAKEIIIKGKRAQVAIWFIVAIVIVAIIALLFFLSKKSIIAPKQETNPQIIIERCAKDALEEAIDKMLPQGGFIEPDNYKIYNNIKISYLCENIGYFKTCVNQHPLLLEDMKSEILNYIEPRIDQCFLSMKDELEKKGNKVQISDMKLNISLAPDKVSLFIERKLTISKNSVVQNFENYDVELKSPLYDLTQIAFDIVNEEVKNCYFEYVGYMLLYPRWDIQKFVLSESTIIYKIIEKKSEKEMNIAIRGCAIPPGL